MTALVPTTVSLNSTRQGRLTMWLDSNFVLHYQVNFEYVMGSGETQVRAYVGEGLNSTIQWDVVPENIKTALAQIDAFVSSQLGV